MRLASPDLVLCCASRLSHSRVVVVRAQLAEDAPSLCKAWFHFIYWWRRHHDTMANFHRVRDLDCTSLGKISQVPFEFSVSMSSLAWGS